jgi:hypothetical protein
VKFTEQDRDRYFDPTWESVVVVIDDKESTVPLSASFWRSCSEVRSADVGRWLLANGAAPWPRGQPPSIAVTPLGGNRFGMRVIERKSML